jgi:hypothetical protein
MLGRGLLGRWGAGARRGRGVAGLLAGAVAAGLLARGGRAGGWPRARRGGGPWLAALVLALPAVVRAIRGATRSRRWRAPAAPPGAADDLGNPVGRGAGPPG